MQSSAALSQLNKALLVLNKQKRVDLLQGHCSNFSQYPILFYFIFFFGKMVLHNYIPFSSFLPVCSSAKLCPGFSFISHFMTDCVATKKTQLMWTDDLFCWTQKYRGSSLASTHICTSLVQLKQLCHILKIFLQSCLRDCNFKW